MKIEGEVPECQPSPPSGTVCVLVPKGSQHFFVSFPFSIGGHLLSCVSFALGCLRCLLLLITWLGMGCNKAHSHNHK